MLFKRLSCIPCLSKPSLNVLFLSRGKPTSLSFSTTATKFSLVVPAFLGPESDRSEIKIAVTIFLSFVLFHRLSRYFYNGQCQDVWIKKFRTWQGNFRCKNHDRMTSTSQLFYTLALPAHTLSALNKSNVNKDYFGIHQFI